MPKHDLLVSSVAINRASVAINHPSEAMPMGGIGKRVSVRGKMDYKGEVNHDKRWIYDS